MVMCKYFLRGTCRFGESCKNEHAYNAETTSVMRKKGEIDLNVLIKSVNNDMDKAEKGNQWPLSCYGPFQAKPCFPGFEDKCFEEIRLGIYEAEKNGTVEQYKQQLTQLLHEARMKMRSLQNPTAEATHVIQELYNTNASDASNVFANANTFANTQIQQTNNVFNNTGGGGASKSIFNNQIPPSYTFAVPENKSIFRNTASNTNSIFAQANQQNFATGGGIFSSNQIPQQQQQQQQQNQPFQSSNIFKNANNSIFGVEQSNTTNQSPFSATQPSQSSTNIFMQNNQPANPFKQNIQAPTTGSPFAPNQTQLIQPTLTFAPNQTQPSFVNQSPFVAAFTSNTNQTVFASAPPNQSSVFAQTQPSIGVNNQSPFTAAAVAVAPVNQSPFAAPPSSTASSIQAPFATNQSPFGTASVGPITENRSIFAQQQAASIGGQQNSQTNASDHSKSIFGSSQSTIVAVNLVATRQDDPTVYSKLEALTENDVKSFEANTFEFGKIPDKPPTLQMCS